MARPKPISFRLNINSKASFALPFVVQEGDVFLNTESLTLTQNDVTTVAAGNVAISLNTESLTLNQNDVSASVIRNISVNLSTESLTLTQNDITVQTSGAVTVTLSTDSFTLAQNDVTASAINRGVGFASVGSTLQVA